MYAFLRKKRNKYITAHILQQHIFFRYTTTPMTCVTTISVATTCRNVYKTRRNSQFVFDIIALSLCQRNNPYFIF